MVGEGAGLTPFLDGWNDVNTNQMNEIRLNYRLMDQ
jgi:hypothetical protein